jgi:capsular exopolysaccharide synthesis family protein
MSVRNNEQTLDLEQVLSILRRRAPLIALCVALVAGSAFAFSKHRTSQYTASAALVFNNNQLNQQVAGLTEVANNSPQQQQSTNVKLVELGETARETAKRLGHGLTGRQIKSKLSVSPQGESNIVDVSATATSPLLAAGIANAYASQFVHDQAQADRRYFSSALALVRREYASLSPPQRTGSQGLALTDRAQSLQILSQLQSGNVKVAQPATLPTSPSSPKTTRNTVLGGILGLLLGVGLAFLLERLDRRVKDPDDLERIYNLPLLGMIPDSQAYPRHAAHEGGKAPAPLPPGELEVFRMLRARLRYFNVDRDLRTILVTSAASGDGKTTVVQNLAEAAASMGSRVLIIESDLRRPSLAERLALHRAPGLAEVLISAVNIDHAVQKTSVAPGGNGSAGSRSAVDVLTAGAPPPNPAELIESHAMEHLLEWAAANYDLVLLDTPPLSVVPDAIPLLRRSDGVLIVSRLGKNTRDGAARMRDELTSLGAPLLGTVANGFKARNAPSYSYDYYYAPAAGYAANGNGSNAPEPQGSDTEPVQAPRA